MTVQVRAWIVERRMHVFAPVDVTEGRLREMLAVDDELLVLDDELRIVAAEISFQASANSAVGREQVASVPPLSPVGSRAVLAKNDSWIAVCPGCSQEVRGAKEIVLCNVYDGATWVRVERWHPDCYAKAGEPFGAAEAVRIHMAKPGTSPFKKRAEKLAAAKAAAPERRVLEGVTHGKSSTYKRGCRCEPCTAAKREEMQRYAKKKVAT